MLLIIDNYDSFTYNLVQYFGQLNAATTVIRNDQANLAAIKKMRPQFLVVSPGPCAPDQSGGSVAAIKYFAARIPVLGVCLGHQCLGQAFGAQVVRAKQLMHGKVSRVHHNGEGIFADLPSPFGAARYHSLALKKDSLPDCFEITAHTCDQEIMAVRHRDNGAVGVQFHPESIASEYGHKLLKNFLKMNNG